MTDLNRAQTELTACLNPDGTVDLTRLSEASRATLKAAGALHSPRTPSQEQLRALDLKEWTVTTDREELVFGLINLPEPYGALSRLELLDGDGRTQLPPLLTELDDETVDRFLSVKAATAPTKRQLQRASRQMERHRQSWEDDLDQVLAQRFPADVVTRLYPALNGDQLYGRPLSTLTQAQLIELSNHEHPVEWVALPGGQSVPVDELMAPTIRRLNSDGLQTLYCCQGDPQRGGAYVAVAGEMPRVLEDLCLILGLQFQQEAKRWMIWDTTVTPQRAPWHTMFMRLMNDLAAHGLTGLDTSGARYVVPPAKHTDPVEAYRIHREAWRESILALSRGERPARF